MNQDIHFIGAGPVGLWTAIQIKLRNPKLKIHMSEKHKQYQRKHTVEISKSSFKGSHPHTEFQAMIKKLAGKTPTVKIEKTLREYAIKLGIVIKQEAIDSVAGLKKKYPKTNVFVGADGAHSLIRKKIFQDKLINDKKLQYIAELKYRVVGKSKPLSIWHGPLIRSRHMVLEHVGSKPINNETAVTLRFFLDKKAYETIKTANFKKPYRLPVDRSKIDKVLMQSVDIWLKKRKQILGEKLIKNSLNLTPLVLSSYTSEKVYLKKAGKTWLLVGDAAFGVPYFRSLNNGLLCGSELAKRLVNHLREPKLNELNNYSNFVSRLSKNENLIVRLKSALLNMLEPPFIIKRALSRIVMLIKEGCLFVWRNIVKAMKFSYGYMKKCFKRNHLNAANNRIATSPPSSHSTSESRLPPVSKTAKILSFTKNKKDRKGSKDLSSLPRMRQRKAGN